MALGRRRERQERLGHCLGRCVAVGAVHADGAVADLLAQGRAQFERRAQLHAQDVGQVLGTQQRQCAAVNAMLLERLKHRQRGAVSGGWLVEDRVGWGQRRANIDGRSGS